MFICHKGHQLQADLVDGKLTLGDGTVVDLAEVRVISASGEELSGLRRAGIAVMERPPREAVERVISVDRMRELY